MTIQTSDYQILANRSPNTGGYRYFFNGKRLIMRCLEKQRIIPLNFGSMTAGWGDGGMLTLYSRSTRVRMHALPGTRFGIMINLDWTRLLQMILHVRIFRKCINKFHKE